MGLSFRGTFDQKVDAKGRMSIPADFRVVLVDGDPKCPETPLPRLVVLHGPHLTDCLHAYTIEAFQDIEDDIKKMKRGSPERAQAARLMSGYSWDTEVDKDGRIVLPQKLRKQIGLDKEVTMVAMGEYFEIWNAASYAAFEAKAFGGGKDGKAVDPLSLIYADDSDD